jgi:3-methyl-2-oxobutanoate hydroxymethyltransferase
MVRLTTYKIRQFKQKKQPIVCLTAYNALTASCADEYVDMLLVGDSLGMVLYGFDSTIPVTLEMMIMHGKAVVQHSRRALVVVDMPFGSYQMSPEQAYQNACRVVQQTECQAVKIEITRDLLPTIRFLTQRGISVIGHIGLTPQYVNQLGGYRYQGRNNEEAEELLELSLLVEEAGAFALLLEGVVAGVAKSITEQIAIPTIGIGASVACDGQILVTEDILGLTLQVPPPRFVKQYVDMSLVMRQAMSLYANEVRQCLFPEQKHEFQIFVEKANED